MEAPIPASPYPAENHPPTPPLGVSDATPRRRYVTPELTERGDLHQVTAGAFGDFSP